MHKTNHAEKKTNYDKTIRKGGFFVTIWILICPEVKAGGFPGEKAHKAHPGGVPAHDYRTFSAGWRGALVCWPYRAGGGCAYLKHYHGNTPFLLHIRFQSGFGNIQINNDDNKQYECFHE